MREYKYVLNPFNTFDFRMDYMVMVALDMETS